MSQEDTSEGDLSTPKEPNKVGIENGGEDPQEQPDKHTIFCGKVGINKDRQPAPTSDHQQKARKNGVDGRMEPVDGGFYRKVLKTYKQENYRYRFITTTVHILHFLQIILGATATAISASKVPTTALTVLTAIVTVVAGILAFITGHGHPGRARQLRNNLREVRDHIRFTEMEYWDSAQRDPTVEEAMAEVKRLYKAARVNAEKSYPGTWSAGVKSRDDKNTPGGKMPEVRCLACGNKGQEVSNSMNSGPKSTMSQS
jgi:hypothetical protein